MELDPTRTAVIAVHLQKDIVNADGAFFAAEAVERDVVAVNSRLLDAARSAGATVVSTPALPGNRAWRTSSSTPPSCRSSNNQGVW